MSNKPTLLIVQGAYQTSDFYAAFEEHLRNRGLEVVHPELPSCSDPDAPGFGAITLADDATAVRRAVDSLLARNKEVVVFMHSWGGLVGAEAVAREQTLEHRRARGLQGGVAGLLYCSAFALDEGQTCLSAWGVSHHNRFDGGRAYFENVEEALFNDLDKEECTKWTKKLIAHPTRTQGCPVAQCAWRYLPSTYIILDEDQAIPIPFQEMLASKVDAKKIVHFKAGHEPFLSQPSNFADLVASEI